VETKSDLVRNPAPGMKKNLTSIQDRLIVRKYMGSTNRVGNNAKKLTPYEKYLIILIAFLAFSAGVLRSQSDSSLEKWWNGKRGTGDWFSFFRVLTPRNLNNFLISFQLRLSRKREALNQQSKPTFNPSNEYD
jgi:hypothetical protein